MAFSRRYTLIEVKGMLQIYRGNHAIVSVGPGDFQLVRATAGAHAHIHAGASYLDLQHRVNTPGEPRMTGTYWSDDDQAAATLEVLNSFQGQIKLRLLDMGEKRAAMECSLKPDTYRVAQATDRSNLPGQPGNLTKGSQLRAVAGADQSVSHATKGFVLAVPGVGKLLQIQTSFPSAVA